MRSGWPRLTGDFQRTITRLKQLQRIVEIEAEAARMRVESGRHLEVLSLMKALKESTAQDGSLPCHHLPFGLNEMLINREKELEIIKRTLNTQGEEPRARYLALYGMGGVGKSRIALHYATSVRDQFDAIFWISADGVLKMNQDFLTVAQKLGLISAKEEVHDSTDAVTKLKLWLSQTSKNSFLGDGSSADIHAHARMSLAFDIR